MTPSPPPVFVLLDLDGTLVHLGWDDATLRPLRQRIRAIVRDLGLDPPFGHMVPALAEAGRRLPWVAAALEEFEQAVAERATPCPGLPELRRALHGRPSALVSNNGRPAVLTALRRVGLEAADFGAIISRHEVRRYKPHPEPLLRAVEVLAERHGPPGQVIMVGDAATDLEAASALRAGLGCPVRAIAVLGGISDEDALRAAGADEVLSSLAELAAWLGQEQA